MGKKKKTQGEPPHDLLDQLLGKADLDALAQLVRQLAGTSPAVRRECVEFLQKPLTLRAQTKTAAGPGTPLALWSELEPGLIEIRKHGEQDATWRHVGKSLGQLITKLQEAPIPQPDRQSLRSRVVPYLGHGNAGMEDALYDVAFATCKNADEWRALAVHLEGLGQEGPLDHARSIYRQLGDRDKYVALRSRRLEYGADYHDLATFLWEQGEPDRALAVAKEGMQKGKGRLDELRAFMAKRGRAKSKQKR
jgi:hypothetical protein